MADRALFVGRFQPFHNGHLNCLTRILSKHDEVVIVIGSAQENFTAKNPFTVGEREEMIASTLKANDLYDKCFITAVPDTHEAALWAKRVLSYAPKVGKNAYSNNSWVSLLLREEGLTVHKLSNYKGIRATKVRRQMQQGSAWKKLVPKQVEQFIQKNNLTQRVRQTAKIGEKI
ncbi:MAG: nicotinamide-nucleotide adenylyltransferase [Candidatus Micrarchaeia archaeon]